MDNARDPDATSVRLLIFSGQPDPEWTLEGPLEQRVDSMLRDVVGARETVSPPKPGGLGYRGFRLVSGRALRDLAPAFVVFRDVVRPSGGREGAYRDTVGIENLLLQSAAEHGYGEVLRELGVMVGRNEPPLASA